MRILIAMNNGKFFDLVSNEDFVKRFKINTNIYDWLKLNDYTEIEFEEIYIRKENICYYQIKESVNHGK